MTRITISQIAFLLVLIVTGTASAKIKIVSTIPDFGAIAKEIGQSKVSVTSLVRPSQDPHFVDAKPSFAVALNKADLLLVAGMELEAGWLPSLVRNARNNNVSNGAKGYIDCARFIHAKEVKSVNRANGDIHPGGNPHYWTDPRNGIRIARGLQRALTQVAPEHATFFQDNTSSFISRLKKKMASWQRVLKKTGARNVVVYHESWTYFLDWAGYHQVGTLEPKPGVSPSPAHVASLIQAVRRNGVAFVLQESFYPTNLSRLFTQKTGAKLKVLPIMVGAQGTTDYIHLIDTIVKEITK